MPEVVSNLWSVNVAVVKAFGEYAPSGLRDLQPTTASQSSLSLTEISPWTNRVPMHEPWPRVLKKDKGDTPENSKTDGYKNNVDWVDQYTNEGKEGREPIGVVEGDQENERGPLWRR